MPIPQVPWQGVIPVVREERSEKIVITPEMAEAWLKDFNAHNRNIRWGHVDNMARDMKALRWKVNGATLTFTPEGMVIDGQHRLLACLKAGMPFETYVVWGLSMTVQPTVDTGKARQFADQLKLGQVTTEYMVAASVIRKILVWEKGSRTTGGAGGSNSPTFSEMEAVLFVLDRDGNPTPEVSAKGKQIFEASEFGSKCRQLNKDISASVYGWAHATFGDINKAQAEEFLMRVADGVNLGYKHPAMALRRRLRNIREDANGGAIRDNLMMAYLIIAWNAFRKGKELQSVLLPKGGLTSENFPEPK